MEFQSTCKITVLLLLMVLVWVVLSACQPQSQTMPTPTLQPELIAALITLQAEATVLPSPSATLLPSPSPSMASSPSPAPSATATPVLPPEHFIDLEGHHQYFKIGCEASAAVDWAYYYGVTLNEYEFQYRLPLSDNPDFGFVGNVDSPWGQTPPFAYGVHAGPVADLLNQYQVPARAVKQYPFEDLKAQLAADNPVIAWVIGNMVGGVPATYRDSQGRETIVAAYEHVVILSGYSEERQCIRYLNNGLFYEIPYENFLNSWGVLGQMALIKG